MKTKKLTDFLYQTGINFFVIIGTILIVKWFGMPLVDKSMVESARDGKIESVRQKIEYLFADVNGTNRDGVTALHAAAYLGDMEMATMLLAYGADTNKVDKRDESPLEVAVRVQHYDIAELMLAKGVNAQNATKALYRVMLNSVNAFVDAPMQLESKLQLTSNLIAHGADVNQNVFAAVASDGLELLEVLVRHGADLNYKDEDGKCAMFKARTARMVDFLVEHGVDVDCRDKEGYTALFKVQKEEAAEAMLKHGADINAKSNNGSMPIITNYSIRAFIVEYGADIQFIDDQGRTLLHDVKKEAACQQLIRNGLDIEAKDRDGRTPLFIAMFTSSVPAVVHCLLEAGANSNALDNEHNTPLHMPISNAEKVKLLLEYGASQTIKNNKGQTALDVQMSLSYKYDDVIKLLKSHTNNQ